MMEQTNALCLFCEDAREEKSGQDTLIGLFPDNIELAQFPGALPKFAIYIRVNIPHDSRPSSVLAKLRSADEPAGIVGNIDKAQIDHAFDDPKTKQLPFVGMLFKMVSAPFWVLKPGILEVIVEIDGVDRVAGAINFVVTPPAAE